jgi:hypothetical protein
VARCGYCRPTVAGRVLNVAIVNRIADSFLCVAPPMQQGLASAHVEPSRSNSKARPSLGPDHLRPYWRSAGRRGTGADTLRRVWLCIRSRGRCQAGALGNAGAARRGVCAVRSLLPAAHARLSAPACVWLDEQQADAVFLGVLCGAEWSYTPRGKRATKTAEYARVSGLGKTARPCPGGRNPGTWLMGHRQRVQLQGLAVLPAPQRTIDQRSGGVGNRHHARSAGKSWAEPITPRPGRVQGSHFCIAGVASDPLHHQRPPRYVTQSPPGMGEALREFEPWTALLWRLGGHHFAGVR